MLPSPGDDDDGDDVDNDDEDDDDGDDVDNDDEDDDDNGDDEDDDEEDEGKLCFSIFSLRFHQLIANLWTRLMINPAKEKY